MRVCVAIAALTLLIGSVPTYDPWAWMVWGRELAALDLDTSVGPAFKPLPVLVGVFGAPWLWLVIARAGALVAVAMAWRLGHRLGGGSLLAAAVAGAGVLLCAGWVWNGMLGNAEGLMLALVLVAFARALDGRHRQAFALGFLAALLRTEVVPFLALYAAWLWRREPGSQMRPLIVAAFAALPVLWLGPDLIGSGDLLRSSERARIPNPGAPALADRPALASLGRAIALAPTMVWGGAALAVLGAARGELARAAALPAAAGVAWMALVAAMSELGYSGEERYALPGVALVAVSAGAGAAWAVGRVAARAAREVTSVPNRDAFDFGGGSGRPFAVARWLPVAVGLVLLGAAAGESAGALRGHVRDLRYESRLYGTLDGAVAAAGGREAVLRCGPVHTAPYSRPALAWRLRVPMSALSTEPASRGIAFRARPHRSAAIGPRLEGQGWSTRGRPGAWTVVERCRP
ncbi:MAG TPA: hypothetical protein VF517_17525 [Thermoleophilaceae bacterium]